MAIEGADYAFPPTPTASALAAAGEHFVCRYGGKGTVDKLLTQAELDRLRAAGISVVANVEGMSGGFRGWAAGVDWAQSGLAWFNNLGMPADRPIYFSVDWDAGPSDWADIDAACRGAASVIGASRVGVYGSYATVKHCHDAGVAQWFWQTYAWSNGQWFSGNDIEQYQNDVPVGGVRVDRDRAMIADYGQWGYDMPLTPADIQAVANAVLDTPIGNPDYSGRTLRQAINDLSVDRDTRWDPKVGSKHVIAGTPVAQGLALPAAVATLSGKVDTLGQQVTAIGTVTVSPAQLQAAMVAAIEQLAAGKTQ